MELKFQHLILSGKMLTPVNVYITPKATTRKTVQNNIVKNINKSRWDTRKCSGNRQEGKKERGMTEKTKLKTIKWRLKPQSINNYPQCK